VTQHLTPLLNDLAVSVAAPAIVLSSPDGQLGQGGVQGWFVDDVRLLAELRVSVRGSDLELVGSDVSGADRRSYTYVARRLGGWLHDPQVTLDRRRTLTPAGLVEEIEVASRALEPVLLELYVDLASDLAPMAEVRQGHPTESVPGERTADGLTWRREDSGFRAAFDPLPDHLDTGRRVTWSATVAPRESFTVRMTFEADGTPALAAGGPSPWGGVSVAAPDTRLPRLVRQSLADLGGLLMKDGDDAFVAAGAPWFLTLFGRDSLWVARLLVPFGTDLALSTLRTLARRQGTRTDRDSEEQPGKILHEVRNTTLELGGMSLPPVYYGTVDATPLFVCTLADAWQWGAERQQVADLLPAVRGCLGWMLEQSRESGWLRYADVSGHGLANQGWKDSVDSVQFADGRLAEPPIALSEVQGYAYEAAVRGAALLEAFGEEPVEGLAAWADSLKDRFARDFWVDTPEGGHVAMALDGSGAKVDPVASNMGHLLGTGLLGPEQTTRVVEVLMAPDMASGFGLRTLTSRSPRFSRLSYHGGSVWPHDTAVAVRGLARDGYVDQAAQLTAGIVAASEGVGYRLPELYGGDQASDVAFPVDYPAACRPQAWAAAAPLACLVAVTGLDVDAAAGRLDVPGSASTRLGPFTLSGVRVGTRDLTVRVAADGTVSLGGPALD
jgi:glycogen debranching enzyme